MFYTLSPYFMMPHESTVVTRSRFLGDTMKGTFANSGGHTKSIQLLAVNWETGTNHYFGRFLC